MALKNALSLALLHLNIHRPYHNIILSAACSVFSSLLETFQGESGPGIHERLDVLSLLCVCTHWTLMSSPELWPLYHCLSGANMLSTYPGAAGTHTKWAHLSRRRTHTAPVPGPRAHRGHRGHSIQPVFQPASTSEFPCLQCLLGGGAKM